MSGTKLYITNKLFDAFLFCKYKSYLLLNNIDGQNTEYIELTSKLDKRFHLEGLRNLSIDQKNNLDSNYRSIQPLDIQDGQELLFNISVTKEDCHSQIDVAKRISEKSELETFYYEPIMFYRGANINKRIKISLAYRAFVLGQFQGKMPDYGTIVFGSNLTKSRIKISSHFEDVSQILSDLRDYIRNQNQPSLFLNRHCDICQFKDHCRKEAIAKDHLSLLRGISETEIVLNAKENLSQIRFQILEKSMVMG